ncbi:MAG: hypothetical protein M3R61_07195, partial [Chloroflexota bacterium]|nr:hypothetical protein [Chloroflexota bacterium]
AQPETESARLLRSIHAFPSSIEEFADMPADLVGGAIAYAESEPGIESIPGWVIEALRRHRDEGWPIPAPRKRGRQEQPLDVDQYIGGAYGDLFRRGSDTSGMEDCFVEREECALGLPSAGVLAQAPDESTLHGEPCAKTAAAIVEADTPADCLRPESADDKLTREIQAELRLRCGRQRGRVIDGLRVHVAVSASLIICATFADLDVVQHELIGAIQCLLVRLGAPPQLVFTTHAGWEARNRDTGNARSRPDIQPGRPLRT